MRDSLLGAFGALAVTIGVAAAWQALGPLGVGVAAAGIVLLGFVMLRRRRAPRAPSQDSMSGRSLPRATSRTSLVLGVSLVVGMWLAATIFTLVSLPHDALPPSAERVAELETHVDGLVAAVGLLGGGQSAVHDEGPPPAHTFPVAGPDAPANASTSDTAAPASTPAFLPTLEPTSVVTVVPGEVAPPDSTPSTSFDFSAPATTPTSTPSAGATPSPLSQPRITSGPDGGPLNTGGANRYDCTDFDSWEQAVAVFRASGPSDPNLLDTDGNGIPCEDLKAAELSR